MIERIYLNNVIPHAFAGTDLLGSEVWGCCLSFERGQSYLIEADSGRGKTSLCAYLYGMRDDFEGELRLADQGDKSLDLSRDAVLDALRHRSLAILFQDLRLFPELSPVENVLLKSQLTGYASRGEIREMLCRLGLEDRLDAPCARISFGQQQRVAFVRMLCQPADFCILDEPVSHLDANNACIIRDMLAEKQQREGCGVIVTSIGYPLPYAYDHQLKL